MNGLRNRFEDRGERAAAAPPDQPQLWMLDTSQPAPAGFCAVLSEGERARAARFVRRPAGDAFAATRAALRRVLGAALGADPAEVPIVAGARGKPRLATGAATQGLEFSVSHTNGLSLIALARGRRIGVDVEQPRRAADVRIAARVFGEKVAAELAAMPAGERGGAFLRLWTATEALSKAAGVGIAIFDRPLSVRWTGDRDDPVRVDGGIAPRAGFRWTSTPLRLPAPFVGHLVIESRPDDPAPPRAPSPIEPPSELRTDRRTR
jgi:phosphopantetheinyl transferase